MSWLISRAMMEACANSPSSLGRVEAYSAGICSAGVPSAPLKTMPMPQAYLLPDKMTEYSRLTRYGMTFAPLTESLGAELLTWFLEVSHAKTYPLQEKAQELTGQEAGYGRKWPGLLAKFDRDSCSWKTAQLCLFEDLEPSPVIWPRSGMICDGECWELPMLALPTVETESGYWPTPCLPGNGGTNGKAKLRKMLWPTPNALPATNDLNLQCSGDGRQKPNKLGWAVAQAESFPTPTATQFKGWSKGHNRAKTNDRLDYKIEREAANSKSLGRLNPTWVEWLMGWPLGWTALEPLEMGRYRLWRQQHGDV